MVGTYYDTRVSYNSLLRRLHSFLTSKQGLYSWLYRKLSIPTLTDNKTCNRGLCQVISPVILSHSSNHFQIHRQAMLLKSLTTATALTIWRYAQVAADSNWPAQVTCPKTYYSGVWHDEPNVLLLSTLKDTASSWWSCNQSDPNVHLGECRGHSSPNPSEYNIWVSYKAVQGQGWTFHQAWTQRVCCLFLFMYE